MINNPGVPTAAPASYDPDQQNNLIAKQFAAQKQSLQYSKQNDLDTANQQVDRTQALSGLSGGAALKAKEVAANTVNQGYADKQNTLAANEAGQQAASNQFSANYNLQNRQFAESQSQFAQQMAYQYTEFGENQKTNLINAITALEKAGLNTPIERGGDEAVALHNIQSLGQFAGTNQQTSGPNFRTIS